ncbi:MAG TPA: thioredoxin family protein [Marmoricola sp.]
MSPGIVVLVAAVVLALGFGSYRAATDGRFRGTRRVRAGAPAPEAGTATDDAAADAAADAAGDAAGDGAPLAGTPFADRLGPQATLLQFSSAFCAPCRVTRRVLEDVARSSPGVEHVEVDAEQHLDLVRRLDILRTPTTLVLGADGREVTRATGAPTRQQVLTALEALG